MKRITESQIDPLVVLSRVKGSSKGGNVLFIGTVRERRGRKLLKSLEYEVYRDLAENVLEDILAQVKNKYPGSDVEIVHRFGTLAPGEISVVIASSSLHREEAFKACMYAINLVKKKLPIWKKEKFEDGSEKWVRGEKL